MRFVSLQLRTRDGNLLACMHAFEMGSESQSAELINQRSCRYDLLLIYSIALQESTLVHIMQMNYECDGRRGAVILAILTQAPMALMACAGF